MIQCSKLRAAPSHTLWVMVFLCALAGGCREIGRGKAQRSLVVGAPCLGNDDCGGGLCLPEVDPDTRRATRFVGGYCTDVGCAAGTTSCPTGSHCYGTGEGACLADCGPGISCRTHYACAPTAGGGACVPSCKSDADCPGGVCLASGLCGQDLRLARVGAPCAGSPDCGRGGICLGEADGYPAGYCTAGPCDPSGSAPALTCPAGARCVAAASSALCLDACAADGECRAGYICLSGTCLPRCLGSADCGTAQVCDLASGRCVPDLRLAHDVGASCTAPGEDAMCGEGGACIPEVEGGASTGYAGGYCTGLSCQAAGEGRVCPAGARCLGSGLPALCLDECATDVADCRAGYVCSALDAAAGVCVPVCAADRDCDPDGARHMACDEPTGRCLPLFDAVKVGAGCSASADCGPNGTCIPQGADGSFAGGYCTALPCGEVSVCPAASVCTGSTARLCMRSCSETLPCRGGYACAGGICVPACRSEADCGPTNNCHLGTGLCVPDFWDVPVGEACADNTFCGTHGTCLTDAQGYPAGYCSALTCSQYNPCPAGSTCHGTSAGTLCLENCAASDPCRRPYRCLELTSGAACLP